MADADPAAFLRRAVTLAEQSARQGGGPFGAVIARDGLVIAEAANRVTLDADPTAHAEIVAIRAACRALRRADLPDCTLYSSCEPCPMCAGAAHWARISRVVFAADRHDAAAAGFDDAALHAQFAGPATAWAVPATRLDLPDALAPFASWAANAARTPY